MIHSVRLGLTLGIIWGTVVLFLSILCNKNYGSAIFKVLKNIYPGCNNGSLFGRFTCGFLGFVDAFMLGFLIGIIYNNLGNVKILNVLFRNVNNKKK